MSRLEKSVDLFVNRFGGSHRKTVPGDVGYRIYDASGDHISYASTVVVQSRISNAYPITVPARTVLKLYDKRLNAVVIWVCDDGIIYGKVDKLVGQIKSGKPLSGGEDMIIEYAKQKELKYIKGQI